MAVVWLLTQRHAGPAVRLLLLLLLLCCTCSPTLEGSCLPGSADRGACVLSFLAGVCVPCCLLLHRVTCTGPVR
jgi:hypothetical protein